MKQTVTGGEAHARAQKAPEKSRELFARETLSPFGASIRRNTWPRVRVYLSTDACLFSQVAMKTPPKRFY
jgi:hypothetical protein